MVKDWQEAKKKRELKLKNISKCLVMKDSTLNSIFFLLNSIRIIIKKIYILRANSKMKIFFVRVNFAILFGRIFI